MDWLILGSVIFFVALMLLVGIIVSKKVNDADDFFAGGRKTPEFLIVATLLASEVGGGVMIGSVGYGYSLGWGAIWYLAPMAIGLVLFGLIMGERLKKEGDEKGYLSMFEWLSGRFGNKNDIRLIGGIVMLTGFIGSLASQFKAMGTSLSTIAHIDPVWGLLIGAIIIIIYASLGGLMSVMWTDLLQAAVFIFGMVVFLPMLCSRPEVGGIANLLAYAGSNYPGVMSVSTADWRLGMICTMTVAPFVRQYYYQRMFASKSPKVARNSMLWQALFLVIVAIWTVLVGVGVNMLNNALENPEGAMPWALAEVMPRIIAAIVLGAITACIMSTADTFVNAAALTFVRDIYGIINKINGKEISKEKELKVARVSSFVIGCLALVIALFAASVMTVIQKAWAILGGGLFCPMVVSYFWKKSSHRGVVLSMVLGFAATLACTLFAPFNAIFVGLPVGLVALIVGSIAMPDEKPAIA